MPFYHHPACSEHSGARVWCLKSPLRELRKEGLERERPKTQERNTACPCRHHDLKVTVPLKAKRARDIDKNPGDGRRHLDRIKGCDERIVAVLQVQGRKHAAKY